eukprot:11541802-Alexandrium_andersonii.AAC.1
MLHDPRAEVAEQHTVAKRLRLVLLSPTSALMLHRRALRAARRTRLAEVGHDFHSMICAPASDQSW